MRSYDTDAWYALGEEGVETATIEWNRKRPSVLLIAATLTALFAALLAAGHAYRALAARPAAHPSAPAPVALVAPVAPMVATAAAPVARAPEVLVAHPRASKRAVHRKTHHRAGARLPSR